jgi:hypothetical protein
MFIWKVDREIGSLTEVYVYAGHDIIVMMCHIIPIATQFVHSVASIIEWKPPACPHDSLSLKNL